MAFAGILDRIRSKKKELALTSADAYYQLLKEVARGEETDVDDAAIVIDAAGKSENDFERDVSTMEERFHLAEQLKIRKELERKLPILQRKFDAAKQAMDEAIRKLQPAIDQGYEELHTAELQHGTLIYVDGKLSGTCLNQSLLIREKELLAQRAELMSKRLPLAEDLRTAQAIIRNSETSLTGLKSQSKVHPHYKPDQVDIRTKERKLAESLSHQKPIAEQLEAAVARIDDELAPINRELADIAKQKLVP